MPWEFSGENLVYNAPPETAGYTWKPMGQNENGTNPEGEWVKNENFDPTTLLNGRVDKYGRVDLTPRENLNAAENRAYQLAYGSVDPSKEKFEVNSIDPNFIRNDINQWWDVDPAYQNWWVTEHNTNKGGAIGTGGGLIGMSPREYITPAAILAGGALAAYAAPAAGALGAAGEGAAVGAGAIASEAGQAAFFEALSAGATSTEAVNVGLAAQAAAGGTGALTTGEILGSGGFTPTAGSSFAVDPLATYGTVASEAAPFVPETPQLTTSEILNSTGFTPTAETPFTVDPSAAYTTGATTSIPADIGMGTNAPLQGPTYQELGVTGVPEGGMGPTYGEMGYTGINNAEASAAADAAAKSSQLAEALKTANEVRQAASAANNLAKLLSPAAKTVAKTGTQAVTNAGTNANSQYINAAQNLAQYTPEQFGGYYQMNKNPFTFSNPMANALKNKDATGLDVSGTGGQALNTTNQIANLLRTLA
jgi:hypothetical protein